MTKQKMHTVRKYDVDKEKGKLFSIGYSNGRTYGEIFALASEFIKINANPSYSFENNAPYIDTLLRVSNALEIETSSLVKKLSGDFGKNPDFRRLVKEFKLFKKEQVKMCEHYASSLALRNMIGDKKK